MYVCVGVSAMAYMWQDMVVKSVLSFFISVCFRYWTQLTSLLDKYFYSVALDLSPPYA